MRRFASPKAATLHQAEDLIRLVGHELDRSPYKSDRHIAHELFELLHQLEWFTSVVDVLDDQTLQAHRSPIVRIP